MIKKYGEFKCPHCPEVFHIKKQLDGHIGGAHRKNITKTGGVPRCKHCGQRLFENQNWGLWAVKQRNLICNKCKNIKNKESQKRTLERRHAAIKLVKKSRGK